jgi:hypothetical protein
MTLITKWTQSVISIRERGTLHPGAVVAIDGQEYPITIADPFGQAASFSTHPASFCG